ncbi:hypothetical protein [Hanstruepera neustonica]|nr:hypothetical protein [Hanstruepera neustonica]
MSTKTQNILMVLAAVITIYGLITGKFLFLLIMIPFGFSFLKQKNDKDKQ